MTARTSVVRNVAAVTARSERVGDAQRRLDAEIGADQHVFEILERLVVQPAPGEHAGDGIGEFPGRPRQARGEAAGTIRRWRAGRPRSPGHRPWPARQQPLCRGQRRSPSIGSHGLPAASPAALRRAGLHRSSGRRASARVLRFRGARFGGRRRGVPGRRRDRSLGEEWPFRSEGRRQGRGRRRHPFRREPPGASFSASSAAQSIGFNGSFGGRRLGLLAAERKHFLQKPGHGFRRLRRPARGAAGRSAARRHGRPPPRRRSRRARRRQSRRA